jgi:hypothetical protein
MGSLRSGDLKSPPEIKDPMIFPNPSRSGDIKSPPEIKDPHYLLGKSQGEILDPHDLSRTRTRADQGDLKSPPEIKDPPNLSRTRTRTRTRTRISFPDTLLVLT